MYKPEYYTLSELAHPQIIAAIGATNTWGRLDPGCLYDLDLIRAGWFDLTGAGLYVNRLDVGLDSRGLRPPDDPDGSFYSVHKQGKAFDLEPIKGTTERLFRMVHNAIRAGQLKHFNTLEDFGYTKTWVHVAKMNTDRRPLIIKP